MGDLLAPAALWITVCGGLSALVATLNPREAQELAETAAVSVFVAVHATDQRLSGLRRLSLRALAITFVLALGVLFGICFRSASGCSRFPRRRHGRLR